MSGRRRYPDEPRFKGLITIAMVETHIETRAEVRVERRCYISSRILTAKTFAEATPLGIEKGYVNSRRTRPRATNMAMVRHLALNLIRAMSGKQSIKGAKTRDLGYLLPDCSSPIPDGRPMPA